MPKQTKVVLAGESAVGKSTYFMQVSGRQTDPETLRKRNPSIMCALSNVLITENNTLHGDTCLKGEAGERIVGLWDTAGQERFRSLLPLYYRNANLVIVMHDGMQRTMNTAEDIINEIHSNDPKTALYMIQNKIDACPEFNHTFYNKVKGKVVGYAHVGALSGTNVDESFIDAVQCMDAHQLKYREATPPPPDGLDIVQSSSASSSRCC